mgnify:CR=1 FL=1
MKKGSSASLPAIESGSLIFATDTGQTYLDVSDTERIELRDTSKVSVEELTNQVSAAKKHSDIFDVQYLSTTSTSSPIVCTPVFSSQKDSSITADDILVDGVILFISFVSSFTSEDTTVFQVGTKSFRMLGTFSCLAGDVVVARIDNVLNHSTLCGVIPRNTFEAGKGLNLTGRIFTHNDFLTVGSKDTTYGGGSQVAETSQTIDLSTESATFKIPKIKPGELGHVSEIENYTVTFSKISEGEPPEQKIIPRYKVSDGPNETPFTAELVFPETYTMYYDYQLLAIEFEYGNEIIIPQITINNVTYTCMNAVPTKSGEPLAFMFLIPDVGQTNILYVGTIQPSFEGALSYDTTANKVSHNKQLKTGSTTVDYGGINFSTAGELTNGDTFSIPKIKVDEYGHVVSISEDESVLSVDISGNGMGIKEFVYDAAHSSDDNLVYDSLIPGTTIEVNDLLLLNFKDYKIMMPDTVVGTLNNIQFKIASGIGTTLFVNKNSRALFRVISVSSNQISVINIGEISYPLDTETDSAIQIDYTTNPSIDINHKELLTTGTPGTTYGDLVTGTDLKKTINLPKVSVDKYGHVVNIQETTLNANFREDTLTDQTSAQYRNIVVVPSTTDLSTLDVPVGTIIFVKN